MVGHPGGKIVKWLLAARDLMVIHPINRQRDEWIPFSMAIFTFHNPSPRIDTPSLLFIVLLSAHSHRIQPFPLVITNLQQKIAAPELGHTASAGSWKPSYEKWCHAVSKLSFQLYKSALLLFSYQELQPALRKRLCISHEHASNPNAQLASQEHQ